MKTPIEQMISRLVTLRDEAEGHTAEVEAYQRAINEAESLLKHEAKEMKTIAQQLNIKEFPFLINDKNGNRIYHESSNGHWIKREYDSAQNEIYYENSAGEVIDNRPKEKTDWFTEEHVHGTTEQRPPAPLEGFIRRNTTLDRFEIYIDGEWKEWPVSETKDELEDVITLNGVKYKRIEE